MQAGQTLRLSQLHNARAQINMELKLSTGLQVCRVLWVHYAESWCTYGSKPRIVQHEIAKRYRKTKAEELLLWKCQFASLQGGGHFRRQAEISNIPNTDQNTGISSHILVPGKLIPAWEAMVGYWLHSPQGCMCGTLPTRLLEENTKLPSCCRHKDLQQLLLTSHCLLPTAVLSHMVNEAEPLCRFSYSPMLGNRDNLRSSLTCCPAQNAPSIMSKIL